MHQVSACQEIVDRVLAPRGHERLDPQRTGMLVIVDPAVLLAKPGRPPS
jgi:hypothetical protein